MEENLLPIFEGSRIGLFGGSFNPAHEWHYQVSNRALTKFKLDKVIWLVSPNNPLKEIHNLMGYDERFKSAQNLARSLDFFVSDFEKKIQDEIGKNREFSENRRKMKDKSFLRCKIFKNCACGTQT